MATPSTQVNMNYRKLGSTGLLVSELCLGAMTFSFGGVGGWGLPASKEEESHAVLDAFVAAGGNFIDSANAYHQSEDVIGTWLAKKTPEFRKSLVIATKFGNPMSSQQGVNNKGASRKHIFDSVEESLRKLGTSYIDLYQIHTWCDSPLEETLVALSDLVRAGKVHYIGCSNFSSWQLNEANRIAKERQIPAFVTLQQQYSLLERGLENDIIDVCLKDNVGILPWSPLKGGLLSGRYSSSQKKVEAGSRMDWAEKVGWKATSVAGNDTEVTWKTLEALESISKEVNQPIAAVALRWLLHRSQVSSVIIGARTVAQLQENLKASTFKLTDEQVKRLTDVSQLPMPYPYSFQKTRLW